MGEVERPGARVGRKWAGEGVAYPTGQKLARTLPTIREEGHEEPRVIPTDLPPGAANPIHSSSRN